MASNDVIKQKIVLEGEKEYSAALHDASRNLKTLQSALKAETAELAKNGTEQQKAEAKAKNLNKQIAEQKKIVDTYQKALEEVKEKYGDNEDAIAKWEQKLNNARTTLANMQNSLQDVAKGFDNVDVKAQAGVVATKSFADSLGSIANMGEGISSAIENVFTGMMDTVRGVAAEIWQLIAETAARADAWGDLAGFYGSSAEEVQEWDRAITGAGADFEQFVAFMNQLEFKGKDNKLVEWLGISDENYENKLQFAVLAMGELAKKREQLGAGKFNEQLGEVFGGKSSGIVALIGEWNRILEYRQKYKDNGFLMDQDELDMMGEVDNELHDIEEKWDMLKSKFATGFGNVTLDIMTNVQGSLDALAHYFDAETPEEREEALADLKESILATFEAVAQAIRDGIAILGEVADELKQSDDPLVQGIGNILGGIVDALKWFTDENANNVVKALEIIAGFWIAGKGLAMGLKIAEIVGNLKTIQLFNLMGGGGSAAASAAGAGTSGAAKATIGSVVGKLFPWVAGAGIVVADSLNNHGNDDLFNPDGTPTELGKSLGYTHNQDYYDNGGAPVQNEDVHYILGHENDDIIEDVDLDEYTDKQREDALQDWWDAHRENADDEESAFNWFKETFGDEFSSVWDRIFEKLEGTDGEGIEDIPADWWKQQPNEDGVTSQDIQNLNALPANVASAVAALCGSIVINMDSQKVADIVTPKVSANIAYSVEE